MDGSSQELQFDLYRSLLASGSNSNLPSMAKEIEIHSRLVHPRQPGDDNFLWCLLRFRGDEIRSIHHPSDWPTNSEIDLARLLETQEDYDFQIMVRRCGHGAPLTTSDICAFNKAWRIPDYLWVKILKGSRYPQGVIGTNAEGFAIMSTQCRSICLNDNQLYISDSGDHKSGMVFPWFSLQCL